MVIIMNYIFWFKKKNLKKKFDVLMMKIVIIYYVLFLSGYVYINVEV